jgi:hypothetical protein
MKHYKTASFNAKPTLQDLMYVTAIEAIPYNATIEIKHESIVVFSWESE